MSDIATKLTYLNTTKSKIKESINLTGANLTNETFRQYATVLKDTLAHILKNPSPIWDNFPKTTATGSSIQVNTYNSWLDSSLDGNTTQNGTPTPTSPIPISNVSGLQEVKITSENILEGITWVSQKFINSNNEEISNTGWRHTDYIDISNGNYVYEVGDTSGGSPKTIVYNNSKGVIAVLNIVAHTTYDLSQYNAKYIRISAINETLPLLYKGNTYEINLGKNLFNFNDFQNNGTGRTTFTTNDESITINATSGGTYRYVYKRVSELHIGEAYTISIGSYTDTNASHLAQWGIANTSGTFYGDVKTLSSVQTITFTPTENVVDIRFGYLSNSCSTGDTLTINQVQLEKGSSATSFSPYFEPIFLGKINTYKDKIFKGKGINLFDGEIELGSINPSDGSLASNNSRTRSKNYIKVKPNTTYTMKRSVGSARWIIGYTKDKVGITDGGHNNYASALMSFGSIVMPQTFTTSATTEYIKWYDTNSTDLQEEVLLVEGSYTQSTIPPYEPYNAKGKWYLHKEIGKVVLNGSENWYSEGGQVPYGITINNSLTSISNNQLILAYCDKYTRGMWNQTWTDYETLMVPPTVAAGSANRIKFRNTYIASLSDWKTNLSNDNLELYYVLAIPTTTEITSDNYPELYGQLNELELLDGLNNITITGDLSAIMNLTCLEKE